MAPSGDNSAIVNTGIRHWARAAGMPTQAP